MRIRVRVIKIKIKIKKFKIKIRYEENCGDTHGQIKRRCEKLQTKLLGPSINLSFLFHFLPKTAWKSPSL